LLLLLCLSLRLTSDRIASSRNEYTAGERFSTETLTSSHVSLFLSSKEGVNEDTVDSFRQSMEQTFLTDSILSGGGRLYLDAFCGFSTLSLSTDRGSTEAAAGYVSGDFFYFHPVELLNGSYLPSEPIDPTLILLDERAAWILFGALDIAGFTCKVNGEIFTVAGVFRSEEHELYGTSPRVYIPYAAAGEGAVPPVTCYEAILPDPVDGYAEGVLLSAASSYKENGVFLLNSGRFSIARLFDTLKTLHERGVRKDEVAFPYWENMAVIEEDTCAFLLLGRLCVYGVLALSLLVLLVRYYVPMANAVSAFFKRIGVKIADGYDRIRCHRYYKNQRKKENSDEF